MKRILLITALMLLVVTITPVGAKAETKLDVKAGIAPSNDTATEKISEKVREELKTYHEKKRAIKDECRKKHIALKDTLSSEAQALIKKQRFRKQTKKQ